ncbi:putative transferase, protein kinase RLK-Pelle-RLCK-VIIa-2 family [Helianthus annuus]|nr:putative transferase, protein kinase RLK-Pelle-RLCK-VIIa-2 family [Helianthus annuus]KAJ0759805.1 putative transferase, protein kinase RLK-Pelle-RLCK-VIIa-2 family [Helianthus annuus]KAJ0924905.1 putative transferase, protein kinase RLK-Pelle-RLCK-VIIa-2 family [Helianthus annuus]KAJ0929483.1 putative transferase, protein kinase RLK-Pelle-RLCK-VIIa-2 family [Helianthus annuus]
MNVLVTGDSKFSSKSKGNNGIAHFQSPSPNLKVFKFSDLEKSTRKFSLDLLLGEGGFGKVFLGWVEENTLAPSKQGVGIPVAVKRLKQKSSQGPAQWLAEVNFLGHMDHRNIVRLLGYCKDESEHLLVYEYMPNRSFDRFLFTDIAKRLSWGTRLLIMIGVARGLTYLHSENVMCRGLKSGDILLDEDYNAKLGDFGLVKYGPETGETHVTTRVMGTYGYAAPEYILTGHLTTKSDIYGYGIVLLVSITGRRAMDVRRREGQQSLVDWASSIQSNRKNLKEIMDPRLEHNYPLQGAFECVALALRCVANKPKDRPSSEEVLQNLEQIYAHYK